jgi:hypothetical protein
MTIQAITLTRPDDWHLHVRDGAAMAAVLPYTARQFARAIIMPNLRPPITTAAQAAAYRARLLAALPQGSHFQPLMTLYLTDRLAAAEIERAAEAGVVAGKLYADPEHVKPRALPIASTSASALIYAETRGELLKLYTACLLTGMDYHIAAIPPDVPVPFASTDFNPKYMMAMPLACASPDAAMFAIAVSARSSLSAWRFSRSAMAL